MKPNPATYIHLGLPKTATTSFQMHLFANHSQVHYFGKFKGAGVLDAVRPALITKGSRFKRVESNDISAAPLNEQLAYAAQQHLTPVLSREGMAGGHILRKQLQALLLKKNFGPCKIILFTREPVSFINSYYAEMLKAIQTRKYDRRSGWMKKIRPAPHYFDINEWLAACWNARRSPKQYISYADTARIYANIFGKRNIGIFIFEEFIRDPEGVTTDLCQFMGIDPTEGLQLLSGKRENSRITTHYVQRLQEIEQSPALKTAFQASSPRERKKMLNPALSDGEKFHPKLSEQWLKKINAVGNKQNRRMIEKWGMPLENYGYRT